MKHGTGLAEEEGEDEDRGDEEEGHEGPLQAAMGTMIQAVFTKGYQTTEPHHGMRKTLRVSNHQVEYPTYQKCYHLSHLRESDKPVSYPHNGARDRPNDYTVLP